MCGVDRERETERSIMLASGVILGHGATTNEKKAKSQAVQLSPAGITSTSVRGIKHGDTATDR